MLLYTRMGFLVPIFWLGSIAAASQILQKYHLPHLANISHASAIFLVGAATSSPLCLVVGKLLNRDKQQRMIRPFGKEKVVYWGTHTFNMFPVEYWALIIPVITLFSYAIFTFV